MNPMAVYLDESINNYLDWLKNVKNASYHTFRSYHVDLMQFLRYFLKDEINTIPSKEDFLTYLSEIEKKFNYSTYRRKVSTLRNFITYLVDSGINVPDPFISISLPMPEVNFNVSVKYEDVICLIHSLPEESISNMRDKLIFALITKSGLTVNQLLGLKIKDVNLASNQIILSKNQITFIDEDTCRLLDKYITKLKYKISITLDDSLIINKNRIPLSTRSITMIVDKLARKMRFYSKLSPTILRRLFAKSLRNQDFDQNTLELILGKRSRLAISSSPDEISV